MGHSYSPHTLLAVRDDNVEEALWTAVSALQEKVMLLDELTGQAEQAGDTATAATHRAAAERATRAASVLQGQVSRSSRATGPGSDRTANRSRP